MKRCLYLVLFAVLLPSIAISEGKTVRLTTLYDFPPYCFYKPDSSPQLKEVIPPGKDSVQLQGYSWDVVRESYHQQGYRIVLFVAPWKRVMLYMEKGTADIAFPSMRTADREEHLYFSDQLVDIANIVIYLRKDADFKWDGLESLSGRIVSTVRGWAYGKTWERATGIIRDPVSTIEQGFQMLDKGRVSGVVGYESSFDYFLKQKNTFEKYRKTPPFDRAAEYLMGKPSDRVISLVNAFDKGRKAIEENGTLEQIERKWDTYITQ